MMFGSDVQCTILTTVVCHKDLCKRFFCNFDINIAIVSFEKTVEGGLVFFDQIVFKIQTFWFWLSDHKVYMICLHEHILFPYWSMSKILFHSLVKIFRFADVQNITTIVVKKIYTWLVWNVRNIGQMKHTVIIIKCLSKSIKSYVFS